MVNYKYEYKFSYFLTVKDVMGITEHECLPNLTTLRFC